MSKNQINLLLLVSVGLLGLLSWLVTGSNNQNNSDQQRLINKEQQETITHIEIENKNKKRTRLELKNGKWFLTQPIRIAANSILATKTSDLLNSTYSRSFLPETNKLANYGLSPATLTLHLNQHSVIFGDTSNMSKQRYILFEKMLYLIDDELLPILNSAPASFVSHSLIPSESRIVSLELPDFSLKKLQGKWLMTTNNSSNQEISQDIFVQFIQEWRLAQALYIRLSDTKDGTTTIIDNDATKEISILIRTADKQSYRLLISRIDSALTLIRPDLGIHYHMHNDADKNLFSLPKLDG